ncbi:calcium homeostasis modulator 6 [Solea senegalensis]|uniref:Calcium homeostasis modulator 6 n=1 Tax=Solea senegalensis TaxID=28829 RepID=A0AAV6PHY8_SOLSE|nr:calcium homeostasis modulator protein 6 [Solea senegalensis]KAG7463345.1 calcium homeostasis modulator 6 [Solea senegalensis]
MDKLKTVLNIANKQTNLGCGLLALLTAGGEQIFSSAVFSCPCNGQNFIYGMVFLLVPALALMLLGYIVNKKTWKLLTGLCQQKAKLCRWKKLRTTVVILFQISTMAMVAPASWIAVALLSGKYYECLRTGTRVYIKYLCNETKSQCKDLQKFPCSSETQARDVLLALRAESQVLGWLLISSIMLSNLLISCLARCASPISYLQLKFWRAYAQEECKLIDSYMEKHAKELAERNLKCFFNQTLPQPIITPSNKDWETVSTLYKFTTKGQYYSTLHRYVEESMECGDGMMRMMSVKSSEAADDNPAVLGFVDDGSIPV